MIDGMNNNVIHTHTHIYTYIQFHLYMQGSTDCKWSSKHYAHSVTCSTATITFTRIHRHMCTYKHMYIHTAHTHTYTDAHMHAFMCALNTHNHIHENDIYTSANSMPTHNLTSAALHMILS